MHMRVINSQDEIGTSENGGEIVHLAFKPSNKDIFILVQLYPNLKAIHMPTSYHESISKPTLLFLDMQGIILLKSEEWDHGKDFSGYCEINPQICAQIFDRIDVLKNEGKSKEEIISQLELETYFDKDLIRFLV